MDSPNLPPALTSLLADQLADLPVKLQYFLDLSDRYMVKLVWMKDEQKPVPAPNSVKKKKHKSPSTRRRDRERKRRRLAKQNGETQSTPDMEPAATPTQSTREPHTPPPLQPPDEDQSDQSDSDMEHDDLDPPTPPPVLEQNHDAYDVLGVISLKEDEVLPTSAVNDKTHSLYQKLKIHSKYHRYKETHQIIYWYYRNDSDDNPLAIAIIDTRTKIINIWDPKVRPLDWLRPTPTSLPFLRQPEIYDDWHRSILQAFFNRRSTR